MVDHVEHDIAFALENLGTDPVTMRRRIEEVLDALGVAHLRHRSPSTLSGGERQRCAVAGAMAAGPSVLVLDEPTSMLDPQGADDLLAVVGRLHDDLGTTVVMAEHRLERAGPMADRAVLLDGGRVGRTGRAGRRADRLRRRAARHPPRPRARLGPAAAHRPRGPPARPATAPRPTSTAPAAGRRPAPGAGTGGGRRRATLAVGHGGATSCVRVDLDAAGRRGGRPARPQRVGQDDAAPRAGRPGRAARRADRPARARSPTCPRTRARMLFAPTVRAEVEATPRLIGRRRSRRAPPAGSTALGLHRPRRPPPPQPVERASASGSPSPRSRSAARRCCCSTSRPAASTPRRAPPSRRRVAEHAAAGGAVVRRHPRRRAGRPLRDPGRSCWATARWWPTGRARDVLAGSLFAPQVLRVLPPFLTVAEVEAALAREAVGRERGRPVVEAGRRGVVYLLVTAVGRGRLPLPLLAAQGHDLGGRRPRRRRAARRRARRRCWPSAAVGLEVRRGTDERLDGRAARRARRLGRHAQAARPAGRRQRHVLPHRARRRRLRAPVRLPARAGLATPSARSSPAASGRGCRSRC